MAKLISLLHKHIFCTNRHKFPSKKAYVQCKSLSHIANQSVPVELDQSMVSIHSSLLGICRDLDSLKKIHALLIVQGLTGYIACKTKLVSLYGAFGNVRYARLMFDQIPDPDLYSWKVMIRSCFSNGEYREIIGCYNQMKMCITEYDNVLFSIVLKACSELRDLDEGRKVHCQIHKAGNPDSFVLTGLVDMYAKCREIECSRNVFDENFDRNVVSWTSMIVGYVQNDHPQEGLVLFNQMRENLVQCNQFTFGSLITACKNLAALHQGKWLHGYLIKNGIELGSYVATALLDMYVKCASIEDARLIFDDLFATDLVSWTAMIVGYTQNGYPHEALSLFTNRKWVHILPNRVTVASVVSACGQLRDPDLGKAVHGVAVKLGVEDSTVVNALIDMYAKCKLNRDALFIFETASNKDVIGWNSIISGYTQNGSVYEALDMFHKMRLESIRPDAVNLVSVLSACASLGAVWFGSSIHAYSVKQGIGIVTSNVYFATALLNFYAKCGDAESARAVFDAMEEKNCVTWSAMIGGYGIQGDSTESLRLFDDMLKEDMKPNEVIFTTILSACSHTGMVGEGWKYFDSMCRDYKFVPSLKHYASMVDLFARAGRLEEALEFIDNMPMRPNVSCFGAFLHGCGLHSRFDLGEVVIGKMLELHPDEACYYVLMANLYASDGRWGQVDRVRKVMKRKGLSKSPACSLVETDNNHAFSSRMVSAA